MYLEEEQKQLFIQLVEADRSLPRMERQPFVAFRAFEALNTFVIHPALPNRQIEVPPTDLDALTMAGYIRHDDKQFTVTPHGLAAFQELKQRPGAPLEQIQAEVRTYLDSQPFQQRYPQAYAKWAEAEGKLWGSDSEQAFTVIGHLLREAAQEFATALVERFQPPDVDMDKSHDKRRMRAVFDHRRAHLGSTEEPFLNALLEYWSTVSDLVQRQEHGGQREGPPLVFEDARRVVFQTAVLMFEVDSALNRNWTA